MKIIAIIVDKKSILRTPKKNEEIFQEVVSLAVSHATRGWQKIRIYPDKLYTSQRLRKPLKKFGEAS